MSSADRLTLARLLIRASLSLPRDHPSHPAIDAAVKALMADQSTNHAA